jgi:hypothetical protein
LVHQAVCYLHLDAATTQLPRNFRPASRHGKSSLAGHIAGLYPVQKLASFRWIASGRNQPSSMMAEHIDQRDERSDTAFSIFHIDQAGL